MITELAVHQLQNDTTLVVDKEESEGEPTLFAATMMITVEKDAKLPLCMFSSPFKEMVDAYVRSVVDNMGSFKVH
jgi:hypothetical protein